MSVCYKDLISSINIKIYKYISTIDDYIKEILHRVICTYMSQVL